MLSEQIKNLRTAKGINQVELAKCLGVTKQSVSNWENENIMP
ncbi:MAG: helix-turn-helix transcriptional regulator, partial [Treponema sp.]|nr:helix-turn-helix transcriptional regulator [Treponema sp.]